MYEILKLNKISPVIKNVFDGSAHDLIVSLFEEKALSGDDIKELKAVFDDWEEEK